jgi:exodeoxyribonuclease V alpha subunit
MNWPAPESLPDLSDHQRSQYALAAREHIGILGGRPGTGKTYTIARVLRSVPLNKVCVTSFTGKACVRVTESLSQAGVSGIRARTTHSLLQLKSSNLDSGFVYNEDNPLPFELIVIDEMSMYDVPLLGSLLSARREGCRVLGVGDVNQLSPVGHGAPLRDLREILPYGELVEIQRNSGRIVKACHEIIDRQTFTPSAKIDLECESPENLLHVERREPEEQIAAIKAILEKFRLGQRLCGRPIDPIWDCQIMVPINEKSEVSRKPLNSILQAFLNPGGQVVKGWRFRIGDKIVNTKNGFFPAERNIPRSLADISFNEDVGDDGKVFACNGDLGQVLAIESRYAVVRLWTPDRLIRVPQGQPQDGDDEDSDDDAGDSRGGEGGGKKWDLAYALSVHKMQGSEAPICITVADSHAGARMFCDRSWIYTALSRAKILGVTVGRRDVIEDMCGKSHVWNRKTFLADTIAGLRQQSDVTNWSRELEELDFTS